MRSLLALLLLALAAGATGSDDFRSVGRRDLAQAMDEFQDGDGDSGDGAHFSELLFDPARRQVVVGARDALYRLSLEGLDRLEKASWTADETKVGLCIAKGQQEDTCRNYVRVLVSPGGGDRILACGTYAFSPRCTWREAERVGSVTKELDGRAKCPHSPGDNVTALMTDGGDFYIGASTDYSGIDDSIFRMSGGPGLTDLVRTAQYNSLWLDRPNFVASFESGDFVYFLFRETATEHINCGKALYSRIARVCKGDEGGGFGQRNTFTTFLKARLNCSLPGEIPFYYDEIQSAQFESEGRVVYAAFTNGESGMKSSAVCSFSLDAAEEAFEGPFKTRDSPESVWKQEDADHSHFRCEKSSGEDQHQQIGSKDYQLVDNAVQPTTKEPIYKVSHNDYSAI